MNFYELLSARIKELGSCICVGIDPHKRNDINHTPESLYAFCEKLIENTKHLAACYKPNSAFFESVPNGLEVLKKVISLIPSNIPVILDVKRGDIASTAAAYSEACTLHGANCVTLNPFMGNDSIEPFIRDFHSVFVLCKTSNESSDQFQSLNVVSTTGKIWPLYQEVAYQMTLYDPTGEKVGLVVGATDIESLKKVREIAPKLWILCPGIGAQGGSLEESIKAGRRSDGTGIIINIGRGISDKPDIKKAIEEYHEKIINIKYNNSVSSSLDSYQTDLIDLSFKYNVLQVGGSYKLKSGRISPYFFNSGCFDDGYSLNILSKCYKQKIDDLKIDFDIIFGAAYKGIPLASTISLLYAMEGKNYKYAYDRKEPKLCGENTNNNSNSSIEIVGAKIQGKKILIIDDVLTAGTAITNLSKLISKEGGIIVGVIILLDREEIISENNKISPIEAIEKENNIKIYSLFKVSHLISYLLSNNEYQKYAQSILDYQKLYGLPK